MASTSDDKELLAIFNTLFNRNNVNNPSDTDDGTGLPLGNSLIYSMQTCIFLKDKKWVLATLDIDDLREINDNIGYSGANHKIEEIGKIISKFVSQKPFEMKAFRNVTNGKGDLFAILLYCSKKIEFSERYMNVLKTKIFNYSNQTVSIGMATVNKYDTFHDWMDRATNCLKKVTSNGGNGVLFDNTPFETEIKKKNTGDETNDKKEDEKTVDEKKTDGDKDGTSVELADKDAFDKKMSEIASKDNDNWIIALLDCDDMGDYGELKGRSEASKQLLAVENEIMQICDIMGSNNCLGYKCGVGDEFGLIIFDGNGKNENVILGRDIIQTLIDNVRYNCKVTISVGFSRLLVDNGEMAMQWYDRTNHYLKLAKSNGKNQAYWGQDEKIVAISRQETNLITDSKEDDLITAKSLQEIGVCSVVLK